MKLEQLSIFMENRSGSLAEITEVLARTGINIRALSVADTADFGILRVIVDDTDRAVRELKASGLTLTRSEMVAVRVPDRPGGLHEILSVLTTRGINVEYMYAFVARTPQTALIVIRFEEPEKAMRVLRESGVHVLTAEELYAL
jgi:hypothetical protein